MRCNALERSQMIEQRIAWLRNQDCVAWIAQQLEQPRVCIARAGRQHDLRRVRYWRRGAADRRPPPRELMANRMAAGRSGRPPGWRASRAMPESRRCRTGSDSIPSDRQSQTRAARSFEDARVTRLASVVDGGTRREITRSAIRPLACYSFAMASSICLLCVRLPGRCGPRVGHPGAGAPRAS